MSIQNLQNIWKYYDFYFNINRLLEEVKYDGFHDKYLNDTNKYSCMKNDWYDHHLVVDSINFREKLILNDNYYVMIKNVIVSHIEKITIPFSFDSTIHCAYCVQKDGIGTKGQTRVTNSQIKTGKHEGET